MAAPDPARGFLGLGSNLGDRASHLRYGLRELERGGAEVLRISSLYETTPIGEYEAAQPDFLNAVTEIRSSLEPLELLDLCKRIETTRGRDQEGPRHGPRSLDIDILLLGGARLELPGLTVPHAAMCERRFVLEPLLELEPTLKLPGGELLSPVLAALPEEGVRRLETPLSR